MLDGLSYFIAKSQYLVGRGLGLYIVAASTNHLYFSQLAKAFLIAETLRFACDFGQDILVVKGASRSDIDSRSVETVREALGAKLLAAAVCFSLAFLIICTIIPSLKTSDALLVSLVGPLPYFSNFVYGSLHSKSAFKAIRLIAAISSILGILLIAAFSFYDCYTLPIVIFIVEILQCIFLFHYFAQSGVNQATALATPKLDGAILSLRNGFTFGIGQIVSLVQARSDIVLLELLASENELSQYLFALRVTDIGLSMAGGFGAVLLVTFTRYLAGLAQKHELVRTLWFSLALSTAPLLIWCLFLPSIFSAFFPLGTTDVNIVRLMGFVIFLAILNQITTAYLQASNSGVVLAKINVLNALLAYFLGFPFLYYFGLAGLLYSVIAIYTISFLLQAISIYKLVSKPC